MDAVFQLIQPLQSWIFEHLLLPGMYRFGLMAYADPTYDFVGTFILGCLGVCAMYSLLRPLEALFPAERWRDRRATRVDILYTWLNRSGLLPITLFLVVYPVFNGVESWLHLHGVLPYNLEYLFPWLQAHPLPAFAAYLLILDFSEYVRHRLQHRLAWWWGLHSIHHSQRRMSLWTDDRNHLLDSLMRVAWMATVALAIGVPSGHFVLIVMATHFLESLGHANVRLGFGRLGDRLLVSPRYHRIHHGIGVGHEGAARGCNFAVWFPLWDMLFGTADFSRAFPPTGIRDQLEGADYGTGFLSQQIRGLQRMAAALGLAQPPTAAETPAPSRG